MDTAAFVEAGAIIIGFVNGIQFLVDADFPGFIKFMTAVIIGLLIGYLKWFGVPSMEVGLAIAIGSSGVYKIAQKVGGTYNVENER